MYSLMYIVFPSRCWVGGFGQNQWPAGGKQKHHQQILVFRFYQQKEKWEEEKIQKED